MQPTSLFRIASISKRFTSTAVLQLVQQGKLRLDDKVFAIIAHHNARYCCNAFRQRDWAHAASGQSRPKQKVLLPTRSRSSS